MDKRVLAIIAIAVLHLTLMWFLRGSLKPEELTRGNEPVHPDIAPIEPNPYLAPTIPVREQTASNETEQTGQIDLIATKKAPRIEPVSRKQKSPIRIASPDRAGTFKTIQDLTAVATPPVFQDTIIWVKTAEVRPMYLADSNKVSEPKAAPAARITPVRQKRSILKKAIPVIRKPYVWVKTLVSKL